VPFFTSTQTFPVPVEQAFDFFARPANLLLVCPPEFHMQLLEAPDRLQLGARIVLRGRRYGISRRIVSEVIAFEENRFFTDAQVAGPFGKFVHTHRLTALATGTQVTDEIEFAPPRGLLGWILTAKWIESDLQHAFAYRRQRLEELLGRAESNGPA
jgi:ligand-binding SRPBCC domain-containing protein